MRNTHVHVLLKKELGVVFHHVLELFTWFSEKIAYIVGSYIVTKSQQYRLLHCCSTGVHPLVVGDV